MNYEIEIKCCQQCTLSKVLLISFFMFSTSLYIHPPIPSSKYFPHSNLCFKFFIGIKSKSKTSKAKPNLVLIKN